MPSPRILHYASAILHTATASASASGSPPESVALDTDLIIILTALLCALFCVVALALVARCTSLRPSPAASSIASVLLSRPPASRGLKKRVLRSLPTLSFDSAAAKTGGGMLADLCAICLAEFGDGERVRLLTPCGHGFHAACVDTWLGERGSCPSCRIRVSI